MTLLVVMLCTEYSYLYEAEDEGTLSDRRLALIVSVWYPRD
jgi:hypothetical protein